MPTWVQVVLGVGGVIGAFGVIWALLGRLNTVIVKLNDIIPVVERLAETFADDENVFKILAEIVTQVRTDSGSSLLDKIDKTKALVTEAVEILTKQVKDARDAAADLATQLEARAAVLAGQLEGVAELASIDRKQSVRDRAQIDEMDVGLVRLETSLTKMSELLARLEGAATADRVTIDRMESGDARVATELEEAQDRADVVAADPTTDAGAAADVASGSPPEKEIEP